MQMFDLAGRVAVVTGGNGGIGLGIAEGLAQAGATVVIAGRDAGKNAAAVMKLEALGARAAAIETDIREADECRTLIAKSAEKFGRLDILVNNAGISRRNAPQDYTLAEWDEVIGINLTAAFLCAQAAYPHFIAAGGGKIINVASIASLFGSPFSIAYGASKGGMVQMTRSLCIAWAKDNIQTNAILPGWIDTDLSRSARKLMPGLSDSVLDRTPAGRWGDPSDFAGIAVFLASRASDFVNGAAFAVDGGYSAKG